MTFNFLGPGLTVNVEAKVKEQIILDSSDRYRSQSLLRRKDISDFCFDLVFELVQEIYVFAFFT